MTFFGQDTNAALNRAQAEAQAENLADRRGRRLRELDLAGQVSATPPCVIGGALVIPIGALLGERTPPDLLDRRVVEAVAMQAVTEAETRLGNHPRDMSRDNEGYDIESFDPRAGRLRFIEVKGRRAGADTVTVTHNEILAALNSPEQFILAIVEVEGSRAREPRYVRRPFGQEPEFGVTSVSYELAGLMARSEAPS